MSQQLQPESRDRLPEGTPEKDYIEDLASDLASELPVAFEAEYELEEPARCPHCRQLISTFGIVRAVRRRVNFVSTLPRRGFVAVCSECRTILPAGLSGLI